MKQLLLTAAAVLFTTGAFAQVSVTKASEQPFQFSDAEKYVAIYLGDETRAANNIADDNYVYFGPDAESGRNLWIWENTGVFGDTSNGVNSLGIPGEYMSFVVAGKGWSGVGYNIDKTNPVDLSFIDSKWSFHMAVRSTSNASFLFQLTDGYGQQAKLVLGDKAYDGANAVANFPRDGQWYNIDIPMSYLEDQFEFTFDGVTSYSNQNYLVIQAGGVPGTTVDYDAVLFHGAAGGTSAVAGVRPTEGPAAVYSLTGRQGATRGINIVKSGNSVRKVLVK